MKDVFDKLKEMGIEVKHLDEPKDCKHMELIYDESPISEIWVYDPFEYKVNWTCVHNGEFVDWGDDDECGECLICGMECDWTWKTDVVSEGHDDEGNYTATEGKVRDISGWHPTDKKGIIGEIVEWEKDHWNDN